MSEARTSALTREGAIALGVGVVLALAAVVFASLALLAAAAVPLLALAFALEVEAPRTMQRRVEPRGVERTGLVRVEVVVDLPRGFGRAEIEQPLPPDAEVVEGANVLATPLRGGVAKLAMVVRMRTCGLAEMPPVRVLAFDALGFFAPREARLGAIDDVEVLVRPLRGGVVPRRMRARGRAGGGSAVAAIGPEGEELREVRAHQPGEALRRVNWKATARALAADPNARPLVNDPERQGPRVVWVLVDTDPLMDAPTDDGRVLDHALEVAALVVLDAAAHADEVGLAAGDIVVHPISGRRAARQLVRRLARCTISPESGVSIPTIRGRARAALVTRLPFPRPEVEEAVRRLAASGVRTTVVDVEKDSGLPRHLADAARRRLVSEGARIVAWSPGASAEVLV